MADFSFLALDGQGRRRHGALSAADPAAAAAELRARGLAVLELRLRRAWRLPALPSMLSPLRLLAELSPVTGGDLVQLLRQLALMLRSGLPLLHALELQERNCGKPRLARALARVSASVRSGRPFSAALAQERAVFPPLVVRMAAAGEASGELSDILDRLAAQLERRGELHASLLTSLTYPVLVVLITIGVISFLVASVIPKFMHLLASRNVALPASTLMLMDAATFLREQWPLLAGGAAGLVVAIALARLLPAGRLVLDRLLLALPVVGRVLSLALVAGTCRTLATLLRSGVPILDGLRLVGDGVSNRAFARQLARAEQGLLAGRPLAEGLRSPLIPPLVAELVGVGEATGTLDTVLEEAGIHHERSLQRAIRWMTALFEPTMILLVGGLVGFVYISFFQVLFRLTSH